MFLEASVAGLELLSRNAAPPSPELPDSSLPVIVSGLAQQEEEQSTNQHIPLYHRTVIIFDI